MKHISKFALAALFFLSACAGDKYPYDYQFMSADSIPITALGAPPAVGSKEWNKEIDAIIARQKKLTDAQKAVLVSENHITPGMIVLPVLGSRYAEASYPKLYSWLRHGASDAWRTADAHQDYWNAPRPWVSDDRVELLVPRITRPSYPSGHTTTNTVWAYMLTGLFPQMHEALFKRAHEIGFHRVDAGVHFPHDVAAGKRMAGLVYQQIEMNAAYQAERRAVQQELRDRGLPLKRGPIPRAPKPGTASYSPLY
ncbi:MAG: phosphatase PAP2 family protein [Rickettsiales bacterium]